MSAIRHVARLALRPVVEGACSAVGASVVSGAAGAAVEVLVERFSDQSGKLHAKLEIAIGRTWTTLEVALAGESFWEKCSLKLARGEDQGFRQQLKAFLAALPDERLPLPRDTFRQKCLEELRAAKKAGLLAGVPKSAQQLAEDASVFARFDNPKQQLDTELQVLTSLGDDFRAAGHDNLALLLTTTDGTTPLLVLLVRYFLRRAIEEDRELFQSLAWSQTEQLSEQQTRGFASLEQLLVTQGQQLTGMLAEVQVVVEETHAAVLDMQQELRAQGQQTKALYDAVLNLQRKLDIPQREVRPRDSLSIRNDQERQLIKELIARYRSLPEAQRHERPALLNAIGKLEIAAGSFEAAEKDFAAVANLVADTSAKAEAHYNAYRAALERRSWEPALAELKEAVKLDPKRFAPFPVEKYLPQAILGAGGFGVAFLCKHRFTSGLVVVKTLLHAELERDLEQLFAESQVLQQLNHPAIVGFKDCGYTDEVNATRPYMVMDFFEGETLDNYVKERGALGQRDLVPLAMRVAEALHAAHQKGILHRDVKPGNLLVRRDSSGWDIKLIDFGLALKQAALRDTSKSAQTLIGTSIAGTLDYAAPEQMGRLPGVSVGPYSDVYGFGKTCCYALFQTTQPVLKHWQSIPEPLAELLGRCLGDRPEDRPVDFLTVLRCLQRLPAQRSAVATPVPVVEVVEPRPARVERPSRPSRAPEPVRRAAPRPSEDDRPPPRRRRSWLGFLLVPLLLLMLVVGVPLLLFLIFTNGLRVKGGAEPILGWPAELPDFGPKKNPALGKPVEFKAKDPEVGRIYLATLTPSSKSKQAPVWRFGPAGYLGDGRMIAVNGGWQVAKGLSIGPPSSRTEPMKITYDIPPTAQPCLLQMMVGMDDSAGDNEKPGVVFEVLGDDKLLWTSKTIKTLGEFDECRVNLTGFKQVTVQYRSLDTTEEQRWTLPVWINPYLIPIDKASLEAPTPVATALPPLNEANKQYLSDLPEISPLVVGAKDWSFGKNGRLGDPEGKIIRFEKREFPKSLSLHASGREAWSTVRYRLDGKATALKTIAAIDDSAFHSSFGSVIFVVVADGKVVWTSGPVPKAKSAECLVDLRGVKDLELRTRATGHFSNGGHSVWLDPVIYLDKKE